MTFSFFKIGFGVVSFFVFGFLGMETAYAVCSAECVTNEAFCLSVNGSNPPGSSCPDGKFCCDYQAITTCKDRVQSTPCPNKPAMTEVPDGPNAKCPENAIFHECSNKPKSGSGIVLCCQDPQAASSGKACGPQTVESGFQYLCMFKEACSAVSGSEYSLQGDDTKCGDSAEVCCKAKTRTGQTVTPTAPPPKSYSLFNPLGTVSIPVIMGRVVKTFLGIVGALALLTFVYAGIMYMTARGDANQIKKAVSVIKTTVIGLFIIMFSFVITDSFIAVFTEDLIPSAPREAGDALEAPTEAEAETEQENIQSQQKQAEDEKKAAEGAQEAKTDTELKGGSKGICGLTPATEYRVCMDVTKEGQGKDCVGGYCPGGANIKCCKDEEDP